MPLTVRDVMESVAARYGVTFADLYGPCRKRRLCRPRDIAMYLAREKTRKSFPQLGIRFNRNHAAIIHGVNRVRARLEYDTGYAAEVDAARRALEGR